MKCTDADLQKIIERLKSARKVAVFTHQRPDPDALGSQAALALTIRSINRAAAVTLMHFGTIPPQYAFLHDDFTTADFSDDWAAADGAGTDTIIVVDTCTYNQLEPARHFLQSSREKTIAMDHHLSRDDLAVLTGHDTSAAAAVEIVWRLAGLAGIAMSPPLALPLMAGLVGDTGWFRFDSVRPETHLMAADLTPHVDNSALYERLMQNETRPKLALMRAALDSLVFACDDRFVVMSLTRRDFEDNGASQSQTEYLVDMPMMVNTTEVVALISETPDGKVRASLRSKHDVDVNAICRRFGGGGHAKASGCRFDLPLDQARINLIEAVADALAAQR